MYIVYGENPKKISKVGKNSKIVGGVKEKAQNQKPENKLGLFKY